MTRASQVLFAVLGALLIAAAPGKPLSAKPVPMNTWTYGNKNYTFQIGALTLVFGQRQDQDGADIPAMQIRSKGLQPYTIEGQSGTNPVTANWGVAKLDPKNPLPQVIFQSFSGGAHCCMRIYVIEKAATGWQGFDLGQWDGDGLVNVPTDVDGDHIPDIVLSDDRFLYTFDSYADSWSPPVIINVVGNAVHDVSKNPRYKTYYGTVMAKMKAACAKHGNGSCAGYAAAAARAGRFAEAWPIVLTNYDKSDSWTLPTRCHGTRGDDGSCKGKEDKPKDFPTALQWFLQDNGYIPKPK